MYDVDVKGGQNLLFFPFKIQKFWVHTKVEFRHEKTAKYSYLVFQPIFFVLFWFEMTSEMVQALVRPHMFSVFLYARIGEITLLCILMTFMNSSERGYLKFDEIADRYISFGLEEKTRDISIITSSFCQSTLPLPHWVELLRKSTGWYTDGDGWLDDDTLDEHVKHGMAV